MNRSKRKKISKNLVKFLLSYHENRYNQERLTASEMTEVLAVSKPTIYEYLQEIREEEL